MPQPIVRMYQSTETASAAVAALRKAGFTDLHSVAGASSASSAVKGTGAKKASAGSASMSFDNIVALIAMGNILKSDAKVYAQGVSRGSSLVIVHPPFGRAVRAMRILNQFSPIESGVVETVDRPKQWDEATPLSCALGMPVLSNNPAPFSDFWSVRPLTDNSFSLSSLIGMRLLSQPKTNWTSSFGLPLLSRPKSNWTTSLGMRLLSDNAAPLSSMLKMPVLSRGKSR